MARFAVLPPRALEACTVSIEVLPRRGWMGDFSHHTWHIHVQVGKDTPFPLTGYRDRYGWRWDFASFADMLATALAHEVSHWGNPWLQSESSHNDTALRQVLHLGFQVWGEQRFRESPRPERCP
jgi:hypothetical protein